MKSRLPSRMAQCCQVPGLEEAEEREDVSWPHAAVRQTMFGPSNQGTALGERPAKSCHTSCHTPVSFGRYDNSTLMAQQTPTEQKKHLGGWHRNTEELHSKILLTQNG